MAGVCEDGPSMRLFVTGAAGFIGSNYVRHVLATTDDEVTVFDALTYAGNRRPCPTSRPTPGTVRAGRHLRPDAVTRAMAVTTRSCTSPPRATSTGRSSTRTRSCAPTARHQRDVRRRPARGCSDSCTSPPTRSTDRSTTDRSARPTRWGPRSPYSASKAGSDLIALSYLETYGLPVIVTRSSNNFGPYQFPEKVIPLFVTNLLEAARCRCTATA